jgi:hypothetical protein
MKIDLNRYIKIADEKVRNGETIDSLLSFLKKEQMPPGFCKIILVEVLKMPSDEAQELIYKSESYKGFGQISDLFLDSLTGEKGDEN